MVSTLYVLKLNFIRLLTVIAGTVTVSNAVCSLYQGLHAHPGTDLYADQNATNTGKCPFFFFTAVFFKT